MAAESYRIQGIDLCKGIGILLVMLGHFMPNSIFTALFIYTFHIPLFFVISGFLFKGNYTIGSFVKKRTKSLVIPYFIYGVPILVEEFVFSKNYTVQSLLDICTNYLVQRKYTTMWFVSCLFTTELTFVLICFIFHSEYLRILFCLLFLYIGYIISNNIGELPWCINSALMMLFFMEVGHLIRLGYNKGMFKQKQVFYAFEIIGGGANKPYIK